MSNEDQETLCHVTPLDKIELEDESFSCPMFSIEVVATFMHHHQHDDSSMEEDDDYDYDYDCDMTQQVFLVEREKLFNEETSMSSIRQILVDMDIPIQEYMFARILNFASQMVSNKRYMNRKVLRLRVEIDVPITSLDDNVDEDLIGFNFVPAIKSSIEDLEIIKVDKDLNKECRICLEEFLIGSQATQMPCLHLYHSHCIVNWLQKSRVCPLCRFEIA